MLQELHQVEEPQSTPQADHSLRLARCAPAHPVRPVKYLAPLLKIPFLPQRLTRRLVRRKVLRLILLADESAAKWWLAI